MSASQTQRESTFRCTTKRRHCSYNTSWEADYTWLRKEKDSSTDMAKCILCHSSFTIKWEGIGAVKTHDKSQVHRNNIKAVKSNTLMEAFLKKPAQASESKTTIAELAAVFHGVQHHYSYLSMDCGFKVAKKTITDSEIIKKVSSGRTKIEAVCENVLAPYSVELILRDLEETCFFSIASDASNKGNKKLFPLCVRYFHKKFGLRDRVLEFYEDANETSLAIYNKIKHILSEFNVSSSKLSAYTADNASVNYGKFNSVFTHFKKDVPTLIAANCNCHVINNAARFASKALTHDVETLVIKVYNEFSSSAKNVDLFKDFCEFTNIEWSQILRHVPTRWLSLYPAINRLVEKWPALKSYFLSQGEDNCDKAIWKFVANEQDFENCDNEDLSVPEVYLYFLHHVTGLFHQTVLALESKTCTSTMVYGIIEKLINSLNQKVHDKFFGYKANVALKKLNITQANKIRDEMKNFCTRAASYVQKYFNLETSPFKSFKIIELQSELEWTDLERLVEDVHLVPNCINVDDLHNEFGILKNIIKPLIMSEKTAIEKWIQIFNTTDLPNMLKIVQFVYSVPISNAYCERVFSIMGNLWSDERNRLRTEIVKAEIQIKLNFEENCLEFVDTLKESSDLLTAARSNKKYKFKKTA